MLYELQCIPTMNRQDKLNLTISRTFRFRGWKLIWQHAFKRRPGATGHTYWRANVSFHTSPASVNFGYYVLWLFGQSFTLGWFLWLKGSRFCCQLGLFYCSMWWFFFSSHKSLFSILLPVNFSKLIYLIDHTFNIITGSHTYLVALIIRFTRPSIRKLCQKFAFSLKLDIRWRNF